jgi:hypothetical protein
MKDILGQRIKEIRPMTKAEIRHEGWEDSPYPTVCLVLENGILLYPSRDEEGNDVGALFGREGDKCFSVSVVEEG